MIDLMQVIDCFDAGLTEGAMDTKRLRDGFISEPPRMHSSLSRAKVPLES